MRDLYGQILGLQKPWFVEHVDLDVAKGRVDIRVEHEPAARWACPRCQRELACRDHAEVRVWRHLDTCQFGTYVHARIPRVECPEHGVVQVSVPWADARSRFTLLMERWAIDVLKQRAQIPCAFDDERLASFQPPELRVSCQQQLDSNPELSEKPGVVHLCLAGERRSGHFNPSARSGKR